MIIALLGGARATVNLGKIMSRRLSVSGSTLRPRSVKFKAAIAAQLRQRVWPLIESGQLKPVIHQIFALDDAAEAHRMMESGAHIGKLVLKL